MTKGERIAELRERREYSMTELADKVDVSKQTMYKYENDIITNIPSTVIEKIADALGTTPAYLMGWESEPDREGQRRRLIAYYDLLSETDRAKLLGYAEGLAEKDL